MRILLLILALACFSVRAADVSQSLATLSDATNVANARAGALSQPTSPVLSNHVAAFHYWGGSNTLFLFQGNTNSYAEVLVWNTNRSFGASSDFVAQKPTGTGSSGYVNLGINGDAGGLAGFTNGGHAYLYSIDSPLNLGSITNGALNFFAGGTIDTPTLLVRMSNGIVDIPGSLMIGTLRGTNTDASLLALSNLIVSATNSAAVTNWINSRQPADTKLTNLVGLASSAYTNVPLGGTNILIRTAGGTNFFDIFGNLNGWQQIPTNQFSAIPNKMNGATNASQFGATTTLTIKTGVAVTNAASYSLVNLVAGVGGANTNWTLFASQPLTTINGFTNVSIRAIMSNDTASALRHLIRITNGSGTDRTLEFSPVTNSFRFNGTTGTNAPSVLTNNTTLMLQCTSIGTNVWVNVLYYPWP